MPDRMPGQPHTPGRGIFIWISLSFTCMAVHQQAADILLAVICIGIALASGVFVQGVTGGYSGIVLFLIVLFFLLYACAVRRNWQQPFTSLWFLRSSRMSDVFLGLGITVSALAVCWSAGVIISRMFSDIEGVLAALVLFGVIMLASSASRDWK